MKLTIAKKIFLTLLPLFTVVVLIALVTLLRLNEVHKISTDIVTVDINQRNSAENMIDLLQDRESKVMRYLILQNRDLLSLLHERDKEYNSLFIGLTNIKSSSELVALIEENNLYSTALKTQLKLVDSSDCIQFTNAEFVRKKAFIKQGELLLFIKSSAEKSQTEKSKTAAILIKNTFKTVLLITLIGAVIALLVSLFLIKTIINSVKKLKMAASQVSKGDFMNLPTVNSSDEIGDLSKSFNDMAKRLIKLEDAYKDASPLTRLPGGVAVENIVQKSIENRIPFAFCMLDLDNFKPFNDRYGYSHGNSVIKHTASLIQAVADEVGSEIDFVGHIGGDDFVIVSTPELFEEVCEEVIKRFDQSIVAYYDSDDLSNGHIVSKSRQGVVTQFPIMTISISAVCSEMTELTNYIRVGEIIAELKKYAKSYSTSKLVVDRRNLERRIDPDRN
jgi:diguanylate cyclase (GGDEF)-like protein